MKKLISSTAQSSGKVQHFVYGLNPMLNWLQEHGIDASEYLEKANIDPKRLGEAGETIFPAQEIGFINSMYKSLNIPELGLNIGPGFKIAYFGLLGLAALTSANLYQALKVMIEHTELTWSYCRLSLSVQGDLAYFEFEPIRDVGECAIMMLDRDMSGTLKISSDALGFKLPLKQVELKHSATSYQAKYEQMFDCPIRFNADKNRIVFSRQYLQRPLPNSDPNVSKIYLQQCLTDSQRLKSQKSLTEQVRGLLIASESLALSLEDIASELNMTSRTIQRKLASEGSSYKALMNDIRLNLAKEYLLSTDFTLNEITERLAFHDKAAFSNAFRRWTGIAPSVYRKQNRT